MKLGRRILAGMLALSLSTPGFAAPDPSPPTLAVVHSRAELDARLAQGKTPLDSLTPYGKRAFLRGLVWGENGLGGFNAAHPQLPLRVPFNAEEWRDLDVAGVPAFFILQDGHVRQKISGWPKHGQKAALLQALAPLPAP